MKSKLLPAALAWLSALCATGVLAQGTSPAPLRITTVTSGLAYPWSLAFLPDGRMLVTEKAGRLRLVSADGRKLSEPVTGVPAVDARGQGGLFDVLPARDFASSRRVFLSYAEPGSGDDSGRNGLAVGSAVLSADGGSLSEWRVIYRQQPKVSSNGHFGGRLLWAPDGLLFVTQGDRQRDVERGKAQDLALGHGKMVRIKADGSVPADNPFAGRAGALDSTWSYGHRNVQGAAFHPQTGELWATEHGPQGGDELNRVLAGRNYGWPKVSYGCEYGAPVGQCTVVGGASTGAAYEPPVTTWVPRSIAPSGLIFYTGQRFPEWQGQLFSGALGGQALWRIELQGNTMAARETVPVQLGERIRDVRQGPDGWIYLLTDNANGRILRLER